MKKKVIVEDGAVCHKMHLQQRINAILYTASQSRSVFHETHYNITPFDDI